MTRQITDKKLGNQRFRQTEEAVLGAFFGSKKVLNARIIVKRARISRSTLYRHHKTVYEIVPDYEEYILEKYDNLMRGLIKRNIRLKTAFHQMLIFILRNKRVFKIIMDKGNENILEKMIRRMEPKIVKIYRLPEDCGKMLRIYEKEIAGVIDGWRRGGFVEDEMRVLADIMYLTATIRQRLGALTEQV